MSNDPAFLFYPGDYLRDTQCLSEKSQVAYDRIMCEHMRNMCISQDRLNFFSKKLSEDEEQELCSVLEKIDGGYKINWVVESIIKRRAYSDSRRKNRTKKENTHDDDMNTHDDDMNTHDDDMENENENENELSLKDSKKDIPIWKTDFLEYKELCNTAANEIMNSEETKTKILEIYPQCDIQKSLAKSLLYWAAESKWKEQKRKKGNINMVQTLINNIDKSMVKIPYEQKQAGFYNEI